MSYEENLYSMIKQYTVNDIEAILEAKINAAGLLLMPVFAGMHGLGHLLYGLSGSDAFLKFARYRMKIKKEYAIVLWDNVQGGLIGQWASVTKVNLVAKYNIGHTPFVFYPDPDGKDGTLEISAVNLARLYIETVQDLPDVKNVSIIGTWCDGHTDPEIRVLRKQVGDAIDLYAKDQSVIGGMETRG